MSTKVSKTQKKTKPVESESSEEETKVAPPKKAAAAAKTNGKAADKKKKVESSSESEEESKPAAKKPAKKAEAAKETKKPAKKQPEPEPESEEEEEAAAEPMEDVENGNGDEAEEEKPASKKRKAEAEPEGDEKRQKSATIFLGGVAASVTEETIRELFKESGEITAIRWMNDRETGAFKGCGWVDFADESGVEAALAFNGHELDGRSLRVDVATPRGERPERPAADPNVNVVFIGGFGSEDSEEGVVAVVKEMAEPTTYRLSKDRETGIFKGFGFFEFGSKEDAEKVIEGLNGYEHEGQTLKAEMSAPRTGGGRGGGRGGGFGGGRGGGFGGGRGGGFGGGRGGGFGGGRGGFGGDRGGRGGGFGGGRGGFGGDRGGRGGGFRGGRGRF